MANKYTGSNEGQETVEASGLEIDDGTLHVDAANNRVGIGTKTPSANLEVEQSSTGGSSALKIDNDDTDQIALEIEAANIDADVISISASALTTGNALFIDHNDTATTAVSPVSLHLDFDKSGVTATSTTSSSIGFDLDMNDAATNNSGSTVNMTGIDMDIVSANATGTLTNIGLDVVVSGADTNIPIRIEGGGLQIKEVAAPTATADYGQIWTQTTNNLHFQDGAGNTEVAVLGGRHSIWVPAEAISPRNNLPCATLATTAAATSGRPDIRALGFATGADEFAQFTITMPRIWDKGTITAIFYWTAASGSGTVAWAIQGIALSEGDAIDTAYGTAVLPATDTLTTAKDVHITAETGAVTIGGTPAHDDLTSFQIYRDVSADNLGVDALLLGVKLFYKVAQGNEHTDKDV